MNGLDPLRNACTAPEQDEDEVAAVEAAVEAAAAEGRQAAAAAAAAEEEGEEEEDDGFDDDDDDDDEGLIVDGVSFGEDRRAEAEEAAWEALGGVPKEIDVYWPEDR